MRKELVEVKKKKKSKPRFKSEMVSSFPFPSYIFIYLSRSLHNKRKTTLQIKIDNTERINKRKKRNVREILQAFHTQPGHVGRYKSHTLGITSRFGG
jgi:hypothetical protein